MKLKNENKMISYLFTDVWSANIPSLYRQDDKQDVGGFRICREGVGFGNKHVVCLCIERLVSLHVCVPSLYSWKRAGQGRGGGGGGGAMTYITFHVSAPETQTLLTLNVI